jgi:transposase
MSYYSFFIGIDVSKDVIDVSYSSKNGTIYLGQFTNSVAGFIKMHKALKKLTNFCESEWFFCFENTGVYSKLLLEWLVSKALPAIEENPMKLSRSLGFRRAKTDKIDSGDLCNYAYEKKDVLKPTKLPSKAIARLKKLLNRRAFLVSKRTALKLSVKEQKGYIDNQIFDEMKNSNDKIIKVFNEEIKKLDISIKDLISKDEQLSFNDKLARSVIGVGPIVSANMIAITQNFTCFEDSRKFCCYSGIAPFPNSSGKRKGKSKVSHIANKKMKSLLSNSIASAILHDPELAKYYKRKIDQGKPSGTVLNALKNKIVHRVFAVIKRKTPYVKLMNYA